jgi:hypothetical protein
VVEKAMRAVTATVEEVETQVGLIAIRSAMRAGVSGIFGTTVMQRNIKMEDLFVNTPGKIKLRKIMAGTIRGRRMGSRRV